VTVDPRVEVFADRYAADLIELGWTPPGGVEREIRRRLLAGEPICHLSRPAATVVGLRLANTGTSYGAVARIMPELFGGIRSFSANAWQQRLRRVGAPSRRPRGVPFGSGKTAA
jgi:hypothetical protein